MVVGDQSSGESSVLESLTGFPFPRAPGLCTRYVTQITCRRVNQESVAISVIPGAGVSVARKEKLRAVHAETTDIYGENFARIFREASAALGIRGGGNGKPDGDKSLDTFSDDILKIEITGPKVHLRPLCCLPPVVQMNTSTGVDECVPAGAGNGYLAVARMAHATMGLQILNHCAGDEANCV